MIRIAIPDRPPSIWDMYEGHGKNRHLSASYAKWREDAGWFIRGVGEPISGPVSVHIAVRRPRANADIDNFLKAPLDLLQHYRVIENDKQVVRLSAVWSTDTADECVVLVVSAAEALAA